MLAPASCHTVVVQSDSWVGWKGAGDMVAPQDEPRTATPPVATGQVGQPAHTGSLNQRTFRWRLLAWWLLILIYAGWLVHNALPQLAAAKTTSPGIFLARTIALPSAPIVPYGGMIAGDGAWLSVIVAALMGYLFIVLLALTFGHTSAQRASVSPDALHTPTSTSTSTSMATPTETPVRRPTDEEVDGGHDADRSAGRTTTSPDTSPNPNDGLRDTAIDIPAMDTPSDASVASQDSASSGVRLPVSRRGDLSGSTLRESPSILESIKASVELESQPFGLAVSVPPALQTPLTSETPSLSAAVLPRYESAPPSSTEPYVAHVFISHSSLDDDFGRQLVEDLRAALAPDEPTRIWYDNDPVREPLSEGAWDDTGGLEVGQNFVREIVTQVETRNAFIFLLSPDAVASKWVRFEMEKAVRRYNGPTPVAIYPVICRPCPLPDTINLFQTLDLSQRLTDPMRYESNLGWLIARVRYGSVAKSDAPPPFELGVLPVPKQFVGRKQELDRALARLRKGESTGVVTALRGIGGIGKTALAAAIILQLYQEQAFPDGIAVVDCAGLTNPVDVLRLALTPFLPGQLTPQTDKLTALSALAEQHVRRKRALIVLDSVEPGWEIEQATEPLTTMGVTLLLTARAYLSDDVVPREGVIELKLLSHDEALLLFTQSYGRSDTSALTEEEYAQADAIVHLLEDHTLAVKLAGAYASSPPRPLDTVLAELKGDLLILHDEDELRGLDAILARSITSLPAEYQRLFAALTAFSLPSLDESRESGSIEFGREALKALAAAFGIDDAAADADTLLIRRALVEPLPTAELPITTDRERRRLHAVLQASSAKRYRLLKTTERQEAQQALAKYYATYADRIGRDTPLAIALDESNILRKFMWSTSHSNDELTSKLSSGLSEYWLDSGDTLIALRYLPTGVSASERRARATGDPDDVKRSHALTVAYGDALRLNDQLPDAERVLTQALQASQHAGDTRNQGLALICLGLIHSASESESDIDAAEDCYLRARECFRAIGDRRHEGETERHLGEVFGERHEWNVADEYLQRALTIAHDIKDALGEGSALSSLGDAAATQLKWSTAREYFLQALPLLQSGRSQFEVSIALRGLGEAAHSEADWSTAEAYYQQSLLIRRDRGDLTGQAYVLIRLGQVAFARLQWNSAKEYYQQALTLYRTLGNQNQEKTLLTQLVDEALTQERWQDAEYYYREVLSVDQARDDQSSQYADLVNLGELARQQEHWAEAEDYYRQALAQCRMLHDSLGESSVLTKLGRVAQQQEHWADAEGYFQEALSVDQALDNPANQHVDLNDLGEVARKQEHWAEAEGYYQQAIAIDQAREDVSAQRIVLRQLDALARQQRHWSDAEEYIQRSLALDRQKNQRLEEGVDISALATVAGAEGQLDRAESLHRESLAIALETDDAIGTADAWMILGKFLLEQHRDLEEGERLLRQAQQRYLDLGEMKDAEEVRASAHTFGIELK